MEHSNQVGKLIVLFDVFNIYLFFVLVFLQSKMTDRGGSGNGTVQLYIGPMFSGKTQSMLELIKSASKYKRTVLIKSVIDAKEPFVIAHTGDKFPALKTDKLMPLLMDMTNIDVIGIDEGQWVCLFKNI